MTQCYASCRERGGDVSREIETKPWGVREFSLRDPAGNVLRIGHSAESALERSSFTAAEG